MAKIFFGSAAEWDKMVLTAGEKTPGVFLQSSVWAEISRQRGHEVAQIVFGNDLPVLFTRQTVRLGTAVWLAGHGPLVWPEENDWRAIISLLKKIKSASLLRVEPSQVPPLNILNFVLKKRADISPAHTLLTDLSRSEEKIAASLHPKTRYNIRVAEKHGIIVRRLAEKEARQQWPEFWKILRQTTERHQISSWEEKDYLTLFGLADFWVAEKDGQAIAISWQIGFGKIMTYVYGASVYEARAFMAPYLLHWEVMRDAAKRGFEIYDWWGVAPENAPQHKLTGVTRFKLGFGGERRETPGTFEAGIDRLGFGLYTLGKRIFKHP